MRDDLEVEIHRTRQRGWSEDHVEFHPDSTCCGAAILNHVGYPVASISIAGPTTRTEPVLDRLGALAAATADAISRRLGFSSDS